MIHELKTLPEYFEAIIKGEKLFEIRKNDRFFQVGDLLALNEFDVKNVSYTGRSCIVYIDYILNNEEFCKSGFVVMSIKPCLIAKKDRPFSMEKTYADYGVMLATNNDAGKGGAE